MDATFPNFQNRTAEKESAFVVRIALQNPHHENQPFEASKPDTTPTSKCLPETLDGLMEEKTAAEVEELGSLGRGFNS